LGLGFDVFLRTVKVLGFGHRMGISAVGITTISQLLHAAKYAFTNKTSFIYRPLLMCEVILMGGVYVPNDFACGPV